MQARTILLYYVRQLRHVTRGRFELLSFVLAMAMHALGHAAVALISGAVAVALAQAWGLPAVRSSPLVAGRAGAIADEALLISGVGLAAVFVKGAAGVYATYVQGRVAGEVGTMVRLRLLDALLAVHRLRRPRHADQGDRPVVSSTSPASSGSAGSAPSGSALAVSSLTDRVNDVEFGLKHGLLGGARALFQLVPLAGLLVCLAPRLAAAAVLALGLFGAGLGRLRSGYRRQSRRAAHERALLLEAADESVRHADLWIAYGAEEKARSHLGTLGASLARGTARLEGRAAALSSANEVLGAAALVVALAAARLGWLGGATDGGRLLAFAVAFFLMYRPLRELADARLALARASVACEQLGGVADGYVTAGGAAEDRAGGQDREHANDRPPPAREWPLAELELRGLGLPRGASGPLSLRVAPGSIVAVAGPTGVGKTTLLRTLLGLEAAAAGEVLFDGVALGGAPAGPAARPFAWVPQDAPLLADTLEANVALGQADADAPATLDSLGARHLAEALAGARLGAGGRPISGGERQWIALARAIATRLPVLLLDEPTSGLDPAAQQQVIDAIARLRGKRTVLLVTHRPEPLAVADVVVRLEPPAALGHAA